MDEITLSCPHCRGLIGIDEDGRVLALEEPKPLAKNERIGVGGLRTEHSGDIRYWDYEPKRRAKPVVQPLHEHKAGRQLEPEPVSEPFEADPQLMAAADKDLSDRNITPPKPKTKRTKRTRKTTD